MENFYLPTTKVVNDKTQKAYSKMLGREVKVGEMVNFESIEAPRAKAERGLKETDLTKVYASRKTD